MSVAAPAYHPTDTELRAHQRRAAFRASIEAKAAELAASKLRAALEAAHPKMPAPAIADAPLYCLPMKEPWFSIETAALVKQITIRDIQLAVCDRIGLTLAEFLAERRNGALVHARQVAMYLCKVLTSSSYPVIGRHFGGKDHTTVMHGFNKVRRLLGDDPNFNVIDRETVDFVQLIRSEVEFCD
ncbi:helix-turn-helix domain-containing protein [Bradyrhizobium embrapense]